MWEMKKCSHGVSYTLRCPWCLEIGLARCEPEKRHSCHTTYKIEGKACPQPSRQSAADCAGCYYMERDK